MAENFRQLNVSKEFVNNIITSMTDALIVISPDGRIRVVNKALEMLLGYTEDELSGRDISILFHEGNKIFQGARLQKLIKEGLGKNYEANFKSKESRRIPVLLSGSVLKAQQDKIFGMVIVAKDITERKLAERILEEEKQKTETIINNVNDIIFQLTPLGVVQYVSSRVREILGYEVDELIGKHLKITTPLSEVPKALSVLKEVFSGKEIKNFEIMQKHKNGNIVHVEVNAISIKKDGKIIGAQGVMRDITERKQVEEELRQGREYVASILDTANQAFIGIDSNGKIIEWNKKAEEIFGWSSKKAVGRSLSETIIPSIFREVHEKGMKHFLATGEGPVLNKTVELVGLHHDGHEFPIEITIWYNKIREEKRFFAFITDVTERKKVEEERLKFEGQVRQTQKIESIGVMVNGIAHNFNNILGAIRGLVEMARADIPKDSRVDSDLAKAIKGIEDAETLSRKMLIFSRKESHKMESVKIQAEIEKNKFPIIFKFL